MGYYDIEAKKKKDITDSVYAASENLLTDLVNVYDRLREVELAVLGAYKTTGWNATYGSPVAKGYPHMRIVHSVLGDTYLREAVDHLRSNGGAAAFPWDTVPSKAQMQTAGHPLKGLSMRHILELYQAIGRVTAGLDRHQYQVPESGALVLLDTDTYRSPYSVALDVLDQVEMCSQGKFTLGSWQDMQWLGCGCGMNWAYPPAFVRDGGSDAEVYIFEKMEATSNALETMFSSVVTSAGSSSPSFGAEYTNVDTKDVEMQGCLGGGGASRTISGDFCLNDAYEYVYFDEGDWEKNIHGTTTLGTSLAWKSSNSLPTTQADLEAGDDNANGTYVWIWPVGMSQISPWPGNADAGDEDWIEEYEVIRQELIDWAAAECSTSIGANLHMSLQISAQQYRQFTVDADPEWIYWDRPLTVAELVSAGWPSDTKFGANS